MKFSLVTALLLFLGGTAVSQDTGTVTKTSPHTVAETAEKLQSAVEKAGATMFAVVDHRAGALSVDMELAPATVVIFGNPKLGTPLMQAKPEIGLDLPVKVLIWEGEGETKVTYLSAEVLKARYGIEGADKTFEAMAGALDKLTGAAIAE